MLLMLKNDIHIHSIAQWQWNLHTVNSKKKKTSFRSQDNFQQHSTQMFTRMIGGKRKLKWSMFPLAPERFSCKIIALGVNEDFSSRTSSFVLLVLGFSGDGANESKGEHIALFQLPVGVYVGVSNGCQSPVGGIVLHEIFRLLLTDTFYMRYLKQTKKSKLVYN